MEASIPRITRGRYEAVVMAPLAYNPFHPDMVLVYANPAQMMLLINSLQFSRYEVLQFYCVGESSCSDGIARCFNTGKPSLYIPCYGERRYGHAQDEDLAMAIPVGLMEKALQGMEALYRRGVRYPISFAGIETDVAPQFPVSYENLEEIMSKARGKVLRCWSGYRRHRLRQDNCFRDARKTWRPPDRLRPHRQAGGGTRHGGTGKNRRLLRKTGPYA